MEGMETATTEDTQLPASSTVNNEQNDTQTPPRKRRGPGEAEQFYDILSPIASVTPSNKLPFFSPMSREAKTPFTPSGFASPPSKSRVIDFTNDMMFTSPTVMMSPCARSYADPSTVPSTPDYNAALINGTTTTSISLSDKLNYGNGTTSNNSTTTTTTANIIESSSTNNNNNNINTRNSRSNNLNNNKMNPTTPNNNNNNNSINNNNNNIDSPSTPSNPSANSSISSSANVSMNTSGMMSDLPIKCNCKKSKCLKLYCECFSALEYCDGCNCVNCLNTHEHEKDREAAIKLTRERNSTAFSPKVCEKTTASTDNDNSPTFIHTKGCRCKKSNCLKKYCECYQHGVVCTDGCKCCECKNRPVDNNNNNNNGNGSSQKSNKRHMNNNNNNKTPTSSSRIRMSSSSSSSSSTTTGSSSMVSSINSNSIICNLNELRLFGREYPMLEIKILEHIWSYLPSDDMIISSKVNKNWLRMAFIMKEKEKQNNYM